MPRRHAVTFSDVTIPGEDYPSPFPASGTRLSFDIPLGPVALVDWQGEVTIEVAAPDLEDTAPNISVNGIAGKLEQNEPLKDGWHLVTYAFPVTALSGNNRDTVTVSAAGKNPIKVQRVEASLRPGGSKTETKP